MKKQLFSIFDSHPDVLTVLSEKQEGSMRIFSGEAINRKISENREDFLERLGINKNWVVSAGLEHGERVVAVSNTEKGEVISRTDGLITKEDNVFLSVTVADCLPVFFLDPVKEAVGLVHAGWRGLVKNILKEAVEKFVGSCQSNPGDLLVGIGPGISVCHYSVTEEVASLFRDISPKILERREGKTFLDLKETAQILLTRSGVEENNIEINPDCTFCFPEKYFSYRRDRPEQIQSMMALIGKGN